MRLAAALVTILAIAPLHAHAQGGGYIGLSVGQVNYEEDLSAFSPGYTFDESSTSLSLYGGYRFTSGTWGIEAGYRDVDTLEYSESVAVPGFGDVTAGIGTDIESLEVRIMGYAAVGRGSFIYGAGYAEWDFTSFVSLSAPGVGSERFEESDSDSGAMGIIGYQLELDSVDIRFAYEIWDVDNGDASAYSVGIAYRF